MMSRNDARRAAASLAMALLLGATSVTAARAEMWNNPALPRSPYTLPQPTYTGPDVDDLIEGNGQLHYSGQWRHWGDSRNMGETVFNLVAPQGQGRRDGPPRDPNARYERYCDQNPFEC